MSLGWGEVVCLGSLASPCALIHTIAVSETQWSFGASTPRRAAASSRAELAFAIRSRENGFGLAYSAEGLDGDNLNREDDMGGPCTALCVAVTDKSGVVFWFARDWVAASSSSILSSVDSSSSVTELESTCKQFLLSRSLTSRHSCWLTTPRISMTLALLT